MATIFDSHGVEIQTGDVLEITGRSVKNDNGRFLVTSTPGDPTTYATGSVSLHRCGKSGKLSTARYATNFWPERREKGTATVIRADNPAAAAYFLSEAESYEDRAEHEENFFGRNDTYKNLMESASFCRTVAARLCSADTLAQHNAEQAEKKEAAAGIRFYYNGIRVDGGNLIPCYYSMGNRLDGDKETITIYAHDGGRLPERFFVVRNESDSQTDYFEDDRTDVAPDHPLYRFVRFACIKALLRDAKRYPTEAGKAAIAKYGNEKDPGQPTKADLEAVEAMRTAAETARIQAEHEAQIAAREKALKERNEGREYVLSVAAEHPVKDGEPVVLINWSESPAFDSWEDNTLKLSLAAAEIILTKLDNDKHAEHAGYDKTKFTISYQDPETGEERTYEGRYDLGDGDGGLVQHIRAYGEYLGSDKSPAAIRDAEKGREIIALADLLARYTDGGKVLSVDFAPGLEDALYFSKVALHGTEEEKESAQQYCDTVNFCSLLSLDELEEAVMRLDKSDGESALLAVRFFLAQIRKRDEARAREVMRRWINRK